MKIGYFMSSEEWGPNELVAQARAAQAADFDALWISDHFHPWNDLTEYEQAGFDELYVNQIGPRQDGFFSAYREHVLPRFHG